MIAVPTSKFQEAGLSLPLGRESTVYRPTGRRDNNAAGRHMSRLPLDRLSTLVGRVSTMCRSTVYRHSTDMSIACQPHSIDMSVECQSLVSIDTRPRVPLVHMIPIDYIQLNTWLLNSVNESNLTKELINEPSATANTKYIYKIKTKELARNEIKENYN